MVYDGRRPRSPISLPDMQRMMKSRLPFLNTYVGFEVEEQMTNDPQGELAKEYMRWTRRAVEQYARPLAALLMKHSQSLQERPDLATFKQMYPDAAESPMARNLFYTAFVDWVCAFETILADWDRADYSRMFPRTALCPQAPLAGYLIKQLTKLRQREEELGSAHQTKKFAW